MKKRVFWVRLFLATTVLTAIAIFFFSSQPGEKSAELSDGITLTVAQAVKPNYVRLPPVEKQTFLESLSLIVRKCAHFSEFALLGLNVMCLLRLRRREGGMPPSLPLAAWGIATLYAGTDVLLAALCLTLLARRINALE